MKLHLPKVLLSAVLAASCAFSAQAVEIPDTFEQVPLWTADYLSDYITNNQEDQYAFILYTDVSFTPTSNPGWTDSAPLVTGGNLIFTSAERDAPMVLSFMKGESKVFSSTSSLVFDTLSNLIISEHDGRSIGLGTSGMLSINNVDDGNYTPEVADVVFLRNKSSAYLGANLYGGVISARATDSYIDISDNGDVVFSENTLTGETSFGSPSGGAIYSSGSFNINGNEGITFSDNSCSSSNYYTTALSDGGAIYSSNIINICANGNITFSGNTSSSFTTTPTASQTTSASSVAKSNGGAIYSSDTLNINNNKNISFSDNSADAYVKTTNTTYSASASAFGGAIYSTGSININSNKDVTFSGNFTTTYAYAYEYDARFDYAYGGAIYSTDSLYIGNNADVLFSGNYTVSSYSSFYSYSRGGAIYSTSSLSIVGNECVVFEKNYEEYGSTYRLRSLYMDTDSSSDNLILSAKTEGHITFYDSVYKGSSGTVSFNADYTDEDGITQKAGGDIIFSGQYTAEHLQEIKGGTAGTASEIDNSQTSEIYSLITLYGGSLQVVDGAKLNGYGLTVAANSGAKLLLRDGSMSHGSYNFTFNSGTTLELQGYNTITATKITMGSGSELTVVVDAGHQNTAG